MTFCKVRFRHINSGKLLTLQMVDKKNSEKRKKKPMPHKQLVLSIGENLNGDQVNSKLDQVRKIEEENKYNFNFNPLTDANVTKLTRGVRANQIFEIENTIIDPILKIKNLCVVKIQNRFKNPSTGQIETLTVSTEMKKLDGDS